MAEVDHVDQDLSELDSQLRRAAAPDAATVTRLRRRLLGTALLTGPATGPGRWEKWFGGGRWLPAVAAVGVLLLGGGAAAAGASSLLTRSTQGFTSSVIPNLQGSSAEQKGNFNPAAAQSAANRGTPVDAAVPAPQSLVPSTGPCGSAPTVQFQGRGLAATGVASVASTGANVSTLNVNVSERGSDSASATSQSMSALASVEVAMEGVGVPAGEIHRNSFGLSTDPQTKQMIGYASLQANVSADLLSKATTAAASVAGVTGYSVWQAGPPDSTADQVKAAMSDAAARAKEMASSAAQAAGVVLGPVESVVAQPPAVCGYGQSGPQRVVQVTVTYSLK